jgi:uncharacterized damage-inducible protein DinB
MTAVVIPKPGADQYPPVFENYVSKVPPGDVMPHLRTQIAETLALVEGLDEAQAGFRYAPGKWSIKQLIGHLTDAERIFLYRAVCFARRETQPLPGFEEDAYVAAADFDRRTLASLVAEWRAARASTIAFFDGLPAETLSRRGTANGTEYTVGSVAAIIVGHERHHRGVLAERYLPRLRS